MAIKSITIGSLVDFHQYDNVAYPKAADFGGESIGNIGNPVDAGDAITLGSLTTALGDYIRKDGTTDLTGDWTISTNDIILTAGSMSFGAGPGLNIYHDGVGHIDNDVGDLIIESDGATGRVQIQSEWGGAAAFEYPSSTSALLINHNESLDESKSGMASWVKVGTNNTASGGVLGFFGGVYDSGTGYNISLAIGASGWNYFNATNARTMTLYGVAAANELGPSCANLTATIALGLYANAVFGSGSATIPTACGIYVANPIAGTITTNNGIFIEKQQRGATDWGIYLDGSTRGSYNAICIAHDSGYLTFGNNPTERGAIYWLGGSDNKLIIDPDFGAEGTGVLWIGLSGDDDMLLNNIEIDGDLNHDGSNIGFFGTAPAAQAAAYTPSNVNTDRSYDADATTVDELADVLGTLIADLQSYGLLQ